MQISMIAAIDKNRLIGNGPHIPWRLPADLKHFRDMTIGKPVVMGRKTFETLPRPLAKRRNIILTRNHDYKAPEGCIVAHSVEDVIKTAQTLSENNTTELMVCGGAPIYAAFLPHASRLYLTQIHATFEGDVYFPAFDWNEWKEVKRTDCEADEKNPYSYSFLFLEKK
ncbi:MAG: dihydrofolate reductase [Candidatus Poribacteria bacterium]|nr:dihydrofolate reductase [Candidatus Poribacteria bacterium]